MTQVELARLQYLLPRLTGAQTGMAQQRGGGAFRAGGGEKKLELDKRKIRRRIATLKEDLVKIETSRNVRRRHLRNVATVSLVGYTNAGKTTLFNRLTSSKEFAEDRLFATLDARHARLHGVGGRAIVLSDTVGFLRKLPHTLVASFRSTLKEVEEADLLVHVVDASSPHAEEQRRVAEEVLTELGVPADRVLLAYNKTDRPGAVAASGGDRDLGRDRRRVCPTCASPSWRASSRSAWRSRSSERPPRRHEPCPAPRSRRASRRARPCRRGRRPASSPRSTGRRAGASS